jgi:hemerythrin-like domain-containing protein
MEANRVDSQRRRLLHTTGLIGAGLVIPGASGPVFAGLKEKEEEGDGVPATEDLMREHGVLNRVLLVYEEVGRRLRDKKDVDPGVLASAAGIIRKFIEDYHEKDEEDYLFTRFEKAGKLTELVKTLRNQHQAGRKVTARIQRLATASAFKSDSDRAAIIDSIHQFIRMYRPHESREDTVLFPAFRKLVSKSEYDAIGEAVEKKEHDLFHGDGFDIYVDKVTGIEKKLGIYDLAQFTPRAG